MNLALLSVAHHTRGSPTSFIDKIHEVKSLEYIHIIGFYFTSRSNFSAKSVPIRRIVSKHDYKTHYHHKHKECWQKLVLGPYANCHISFRYSIKGQEECRDHPTHFVYNTKENKITRYWCLCSERVSQDCWKLASRLILSPVFCTCLQKKVRCSATVACRAYCIPCINYIQ